ncbi:hypothetical protein ACLB2K_004851 [Fragaria x ananassa]
MASHFSLSAVSLITLLFLATTASPNAPSSTIIAVTYSTSTIATYPTPPLPERMASTVTSLGLVALLLDVSDPNLVCVFLYSNTTLLLTIPNALVPPLAANRTNALWWPYAHVVPFFPRTKIAAISVPFCSAANPYVFYNFKHRCFTARSPSKGGGGGGGIGDSDGGGGGGVR